MVGAALLTLAGCNLPVDQRGNLPKPDALDQIKPGETDKATTTRLLGTPSSIAAFDADTWYYISRETKQIAFLKPEVLDQEVVVIHFDKNGVVDSLTRKNKQDAQALVPNPNATPASGREFTFLEQLIGNFGKFNSANADTTKK
jgi:outer membrane protein assembly factor BamE (lipoprotein component of BamABCDE complex)